MSTATVSRVLNNSSSVSDSARRRVLRVVRDLGYRPSHAARNLVRRKTDTLGVVFPEAGSGFYGDLLRGINGVAAANGQHILTAFAHGERDEKDLLTHILVSGRVDGVLVLNLSLSDAFLSEAVRGGVPAVIIDSPATGDGLTSVCIDNAGGAAAIASHLLAHGYRDCAILAGPRENHDSTERLRAVLEVSRQMGCEIAEDRIWHGTFTVQSGSALTAAWLDGGRPLPRALIALNDAMALGAMTALKERGFRVPEDAAVAGFDDCESAAFVGLTTVHVPVTEMGRLACRTLQALIRGESSGRRLVIPTHLVVRESCGCGGDGRRPPEGGAGAGSVRQERGQGLYL